MKLKYFNIIWNISSTVWGKWQTEIVQSVLMKITLFQLNYEILEWSFQEF